MVGIYKITNPKGKVYIGQAVDIEKRWMRYQKLYNCKKQTHLYNSFVAYGINNHLFEVIEECLEKDLSRRERHWQEYFDVLSENGLNCKLHTVEGKSGKLSEKTKQRISIGQKGKVITEEQKRKISQTLRGRKVPEEAIRKAVESRIASGKHKRTSATRQKMSDAKKGIKLPLRSDEHRRKISEAKKGKKHSEETLKKLKRIKGKQKNPRLSQEKVECPYCGKVGGNAMRRWHFKNCKHVT
jgi:group I intron endonuclease